MPESLGIETRIVFIEDPEPRKLHLEFEASTNLKKGQQVKLTSDGKIAALGAGESSHLNIGVLIQDVDSGDNATVAVKGFAVIYARSTGAIEAGPVKIASYNDLDNRPVYENLDGLNDAVTLTVGYNLDQLAAAGENKIILI